MKLNTPIKRKLYQWSKVDHVRLHQMGEDLCSDFLSTYSSSTPTTILWEEFKAMCCKCLNMVPTKETTVKTGLHGLVIVLNHYHDKSKDCTTELAILVYLMIGYGITALKNSLNNNVGKHTMTIFAILLMHRGGQLQRSYGHLLNNKKMIIVEWHPCRTMVLHIMTLKAKLR